MSTYVDILKTKPHDKRYLDRYLKFIEYCKNNKSKDKKIAHHICPKANEMFPEYKNFSANPWNKIILTERQHFIAHLILWKVYKNDSMTYTLNMMRNFEGRKINSRLYEDLRKDISQIISKTNKGRKRTLEEKARVGRMSKNKIVVFHVDDPDRNYFMIDKRDENYDPKIHIFHRSGYKHKNETKKKIGRPGKMCCYNEKTDTMLFVNKGELIPPGFVRGGRSNEKISEFFSNTIWCHNPITKKTFEFQQMKYQMDLLPADFLTRILDLKRQTA